MLATTVISLISDLQRRKQISDLLKPFCHFSFYDAIDGRVPSDIIENNNSSFVENFQNRQISDVEKACTLSHYFALKEISEKFDTILILEDDIVEVDPVRFDLFKLCKLKDGAVYILGGQNGLKLQRFFNTIWRINFVVTGQIFVKIPTILHRRIYRTCCYAMNRQTRKQLLMKNKKLSVADDWQLVAEQCNLSIYYVPIFSHPIDLNNSHIAAYR